MINPEYGSQKVSDWLNNGHQTDISTDKLL